MTDRNRINQLLEMAWNTKSKARTLAIVNQILEMSPNNVDALILKADNTENAPERTQLLLHALEALNTPGNFVPEDEEVLRFVVNHRLAFTAFYDNKFREAVAYCKTAMEYAHCDGDDEDLALGRSSVKSLYYRLLIELKDWQGTLSETMRDDEHNLSWGYSRLVAAWMLAPEDKRGVCAGMFWDVLMMGPDVPFYMLGYFPEPDENAGDKAHDEFEFALLYYDALSASEEFFNWFSRGTILFGLLSGRFNEREREYMLDVLDTLGGWDEYEKMSSIIVEGDDEAVIEMLAANKCLAE
ncbi:MAG: hypothetical protein IJR85_01195 [Synergistaceae bacterium]|nr:hypothetical protein [Synergistaceae bacterium]